VWRFCARAYLCSLVCVLSHLLLDCTNIYGVRMLLRDANAQKNFPVRTLDPQSFD
jgi:membrane-bound metal-dependent hydrolase YbcI (DUF457 family)